MRKAHRLRRCREDEGTIAVMAAVIIPVVLLVIALALASLVWGTSETETQRASDQAALQTAASTVLVPSVGASATVFPTISSAIPSSVTASLSYTLSGLSGAVTTTLNQQVTNCKTVGNVYTAVTPFTNLITGLTSILPGGMSTSTATLNAALSTLNAINPSLASALQSSNPACTTITVVPDSVASAYSNACAVAKAAMASGRAPWSNNFFQGSGSSVPDCDTNGRVSVSMSDQGNSLLNLGGTGYNVPLLAGSTLGGSSGTVTPTTTFTTVQALLASLGVRLSTALPNSLCPEVSVSVDQPVKGPLFNRVSVPNGRSTARRVIKNAVIVPVFNGVSVVSPTATVTGTVSPAANLNTTVLGPLQPSLVNALNAMDATINQKLATAGTVVSSVSGAQIGQLNLLECLADTVGNLYNPPTSSGSAQTSSQITATTTAQASAATATMVQTLTDAAASGDPVQVIQVGVKNCNGASTALDIYTTCVSPALGTVANTLTGLYDVPFLDVTPAIVSNVGNGNFTMVPVSAAQASGAFRSVLVRGSADDRFLP